MGAEAWGSITGTGSAWNYNSGAWRSQPELTGAPKDPDAEKR